MYRIQRESWGFRLRFGGFITRREMERWRRESESFLRGAAEGFGVYVDMHDLQPLPSDTQRIMVEGQALYRRSGMARSAVIVDSVMTALQFKELARESGICAWERYLSSRDPGAEELAIEWLRDGVDPDL